MKSLSLSVADGQTSCRYRRRHRRCRRRNGVADRQSCRFQQLSSLSLSSSSSSSLSSLPLLFSKKLVVTFLFVATLCTTTSLVSSLSLHRQHPQKYPEKNNNSMHTNNSSRRKVLIQTINSVGIIGSGVGSGFIAATNPAFADTAPVPADSDTASTKSAFDSASASSNEDRIQHQLLLGQGPISIIGASGRTGSLCVTACLRRGIPVKALTRTGVWQPPEHQQEEFKYYDHSLLSIVQCDVTKAKTGRGNGDDGDDNTEESVIITQIRTAIQGSRSVIYAASSSKKGGSPSLVDNKGVVNTAKACIGENISNYIVISSTATTRPKSLGYIFTNLSVGGNIMGEKRKGELGVIESYHKLLVASSSTSATSTSLPSFVIIRPGGLEEPKRNSILGPTALEVSQGDVLAGIISRADLAEFTIETALLASAPANNNNNKKKKTIPRNTAIELYYTNSVVPSESKFKKQFLTSSSSSSSTTNTNTNTNTNDDNKQEDELPPTRLHGSSYGTLFEGVKSNIDFY